MTAFALGLASGLAIGGVFVASLAASVDRARRRYEALPRAQLLEEWAPSLLRLDSPPGRLNSDPTMHPSTDGVHPSST